MSDGRSNLWGTHNVFSLEMFEDVYAFQHALRMLNDEDRGRVARQGIILGQIAVIEIREFMIASDREGNPLQLSSEEACFNYNIEWKPNMVLVIQTWQVMQ